MGVVGDPSGPVEANGTAGCAVETLRIVESVMQGYAKPCRGMIRSCRGMQGHEALSEVKGKDQLLRLI